MAKTIHLFDKRSKILLLFILLAAALFRFFNTNWDLGHFFHPDERNIANAVSAIRLFSQMDPKFYAYGGFVIYLYKITADLLVILTKNPTIALDWGMINIIGRSYSAFFSVITIIPLYYLGAKIFSKPVGFLACIIYAFTVSSIQTAHYSTTESILTFLITLIVSLTVTFFQKPSLKKILLIGVTLGIAVATKTTGVSFIVTPLVSLSILIITKKIKIPIALLYILALSATAFVVFSLFSPFTFLNFSKFMESMQYENSVVLGTNPVVYTLQFLHTPRYLFQLINLFWQLGLFAFFAVSGVVYCLISQLKKRNWIFIVFISFPFLYFLYVGSWYTKFIRYMVPLFPFLILCGSQLLIEIYQKNRTIGKAIIGVVIGVTILYATAFLSIYSHEQTRIASSKWIYSHIPKGSVILSEHWDDGQPIPLSDGSPNDYELYSLAIYDEDNSNKISYYANYLSNADYLTINSRRLYGTLMHLPDKYPVTKHYYELLFSEKLGYKKVAEFSSYPQLFGLKINDDESEETFQVYDHPKTFIYKNEKRLSATQLEKLLQLK